MPRDPKDLKKGLELLKARIIDFQSRKVLADLPSPDAGGTPRAGGGQVKPVSAPEAKAPTAEVPSIEGGSEKVSEAKPAGPVPKFESARYGTPSGHIWVTQAHHHDGTKSIGVGSAKAEAKSRAASKESHFEHQEPFHLMSAHEGEPTARKRSLLIVGANNYMRDKVPYAVLQQHDVHLMLHPTAENHWHVGALMFDRTRPDAVHYTSAKHADPQKALDHALHGVVARYHESASSHQAEGQAPGKHDAKKATWLTHWLYRQPKVTLSDVRNLDTHGEKDAVKKSSLRPGNSFDDLKKFEE
jgi:hypothetical protein